MTEEEYCRLYKKNPHADRKISKEEFKEYFSKDIPLEFRSETYGWKLCTNPEGYSDSIEYRVQIEDVNRPFLKFHSNWDGQYSKNLPEGYLF
jgi:hypothetical protein